MATARYHVRIDRSPDEVWKVVADAAGISDWFPGIVAATATDATRTITIDGGIELQEDIVTSDGDLRRFQYSIVGGAMTPEFHLGTIDVIEDGAGSLVIYSTDMRPDDLLGLVGPATEGGLGGLKQQLER